MKVKLSGSRRSRRLVLAFLSAAMMLCLSACGEKKNVKEFQDKANLLEQEAMADWVIEGLGEAPAGNTGYVVFFSVCDGTSRASVYSGTGKTPKQAWDDAAANVEENLKEEELSPAWVKVDLAYHSEALPGEELEKALRQSRRGFFRYGLAFDEEFNRAFLEEELNGAGIYDYESGGVNLERMNLYLESQGREKLSGLPEEYIVFGCACWLCDEESAVHKLNVSGLSYGRRSVDSIDGAYAGELAEEAAGFLASQVKGDGSFVYGCYPRFDEEIKGDNFISHSGALWSLIRAYRLAPKEELAEKIELALAFMLEQIGYDKDGRAFVYEEKNNEIKLGGGALALIVLTEYMDVFQNTDYVEDCRALGGGLISMMDRKTGRFVHVLNGDLTLKEEFRTAYYDGEAAFALARLYGLTGEQIWLDAAQLSVDYMIAEKDGRYANHWTAYTMNEITRYVTENSGYYSFALENVQKNLEEIYERETTDPYCLETLMVAFELYDRIVSGGNSVEGFQIQTLLATIYARAERQLDGQFYPEYAMYMKNPQKVLWAFMVRDEDFCIRIDNLQHNICGFSLYAENYEKMLTYVSGTGKRG